MPNHTKQNERRAATREQRERAQQTALAFTEIAQAALGHAKEHIDTLPGNARDQQMQQDAAVIAGFLARLSGLLCNALQADQFGEES